MHRRGFLHGAGAAALTCLVPLQAQARLSCYPIHNAKNRCVAGLTNTPPIDPQPCRELSWASCLCYMLSGYGANICNRSILARYGESETCGPARQSDASRLMGAAGIWKDNYARRFLIQTERLPDLHLGEMSLDKAQVLISRITRQPILCGSAGHTTLLTEISYVDGLLSRLQIRSAKVRDPWTSSENLRALSEDELETPAYLIGLSIRALP